MQRHVLLTDTEWPGHMNDAALMTIFSQDLWQSTFHWVLSQWGLLGSSLSHSDESCCITAIHKLRDIINEVIGNDPELIVLSLGPFWCTVSVISGLPALRNTVTWSARHTVLDVRGCLRNTQLALCISKTLSGRLPSAEPEHRFITLNTH